MLYTGKNVEEDDEDSLPIFAQLNFSVNQCSCCGKNNIKRTIEIVSDQIDPIYLGVSCAGQWFNVNLSGNPYMAASRLSKKLRSLDNSQIERIIDLIEEYNS